MKNLILKEIRSLLYSPKFLLSFSLCSVLLVVSFWIGVKEYKNQRAQYALAVEMTQQQMREQTRWSSLNTRAYREPQPAHILSSGITNDLGRFSNISQRFGVQLDGSTFSQDPLFALFRLVDPGFIVQIIFSLFAIVFTYDAICGEREDGTLKLIFANSVSRAKLMFAKVIGSAAGFLLPLSVPVLICALIGLVSGAFSSASDWMIFAGFMGASALYLMFFMVLGITISAFSYRTSVSFLVLLVIWISTVLIIPRAGVMMAGQLVKVPGSAELESKRSSFERQQWDNMSQELTKTWSERTAFINSFPESERAAKREEMEWDWSEQDTERRRKVETDLAEYRKRLEEEVLNLRKSQESLSLTLARISPASLYQLAINALSDSGLELKNDSETAMREYASQFGTYVRDKMAKNQDQGGIRISFDSNTGARFDLGAQRSAGLDVSDAPKFVSIKSSIAHRMYRALPDLAMLSVLTLILFAVGFAGFLRYDVR